jgi:hypothetical protein
MSIRPVTRNVRRFVKVHTPSNGTSGICGGSSRIPNGEPPCVPLLIVNPSRAGVHGCAVIMRRRRLSLRLFEGGVHQTAQMQSIPRRIGRIVVIKIDVNSLKRGRPGRSLVRTRSSSVSSCSLMMAFCAPRMNREDSGDPCIFVDSFLAL